MKMLFITLLILLSCANSYGATLTLNSGETTVIEANMTTTVTCGGDMPSNCDAEFGHLHTILSICSSAKGTELHLKCYEKTMSKWTRSKLGCATEGTAICLQFCGDTVECVMHCQ